VNVEWILPAIALIFILLAVYHLSAAGRIADPSDDSSRITANVRKRIGAVFLLVGAGLLAYFWLAF
jgi:uncharacterized membrane protein YidH (DUF202 family)